MPKLKQLLLPVERPEDNVRLEGEVAIGTLRTMAALLLHILDARGKEESNEP